MPEPAGLPLQSGDNRGCLVCWSGYSSLVVVDDFDLCYTEQKELIGLWARAFVCSQREPVFLSTTLWHATTRYFCSDSF